MTEAAHDTVLTPKAWYRATCEQSGFVCDETQLVAVEELERLWHELVEFKHKRDGFLGRSLLSPEVPSGLYIWGGVGRGKTFLMDGFYHCLPYRRKRRIHFHHFITEVHHELQRLADQPDPLMALAEDIAHATRVLCLDEFHVEDIADAMILGRLLEALFRHGVVLLTTSNFPPDGLYPNGLQRQNFLPAIALLKRRLRVLHFDGRKDYRLMQVGGDALFMHCCDAQHESRMTTLFDKLTFGRTELGGSIAVGHVQIPVRRAAREAVWFDFGELCGGNHDHADYLEIARRYHTVFLSDVPKMTSSNGNVARRFAWLIDVLYDHHVKLVASFAVEPCDLYDTDMDDSEFKRIASRLAEMQTRHYLELPHLNNSISLTM
ncbi:MAG: cell division protein ZapE [Gallionella sp.]|nr:cell division protein ZapE [Gallionella sp.]MDD4945974.1 cell division protein ZapE [Gallionella sp.]